MIKVSTSIPKILGKLYGSPKKIENSRASLRKKKSKFLGHVPSEQIFYRNISLSAPDSGTGGSSSTVAQPSANQSPMFHQILPPQPLALRPSGEVAENWKLWKEKYNNYFFYF